MIVCWNISSLIHFCGLMFLFTVFRVFGQEDVPNDPPGVPSNRDRLLNGFQITSSGRRQVAGRSRSANNRLTAAAQAQYPDYFRVEVEIQRLENPKGVLTSGKSCDVFNNCDPRISAYLDTSKPIAAWPGSYSPSRWPVIFEASNDNSPQIGKVITRDICGGAVNTVNARVRVVDADDTSSNDDIGDFNCQFDLAPADVGQPSLTAWSSSTACQSTSGQGTTRLFARIRAYQIPSSSCKA